MKRLLALILALACTMTLLTACGPDRRRAGPDMGVSAEDYVAPDLSGKEIQIIAWENTDCDVGNSWAMKKVEEKLGCDVKYTTLDSWNSQYAPMISEGKVPDLTHANHYNETYDRYGRETAYVNLMNYLDYMPNIKKFVTDPSKANVIARYTTTDGEMYCLPMDVGDPIDPYTFLYRKDVFDSMGLTFPTNQEEFVKVLEALKAKYPDSMPFVMRAINGNMQSIQGFSHLWGGTHVLQGNYNGIFTLDENGNYYLAQVSNAYKEMAIFLNDLLNRGLMHKSGPTMDAASWYESFASNTSFVTFDKVDRLPQMNRTGQSLNPNFQVVAAAPFNFGTHATESDVVTTSFKAGIGSGTSFWYAIGNNENAKVSMAYLDWIYSEEGQLMTNWGVEGESYTVDENGNKQFIESFLQEQRSLTMAGLYSPGMAGIRETAAWMASLSETDSASLDLALQYTGKDPAQHMIRYSDDQQFDYDTFALPLYNYVNGQWVKFLLGERPFSEWDQVLQKAKSDYYYDEMLALHEAALAALLERQNNG